MKHVIVPGFSQREEIRVVRAAAVILLRNASSAKELGGNSLVCVRAIIDQDDASVGDRSCKLQDSIVPRFPTVGKTAMAAMDVNGEQQFVKLSLPGSNLVW